MIDLLANMFAGGIIDRKGRFRETAKSKYVRQEETGGEYVLARAKEYAIGEDIVFTQADVDFSTSQEFMQQYSAAMFLPHTDLQLFPSMRKMVDALTGGNTS